MTEQAMDRDDDLRGKMPDVIYALKGIFWALNVLTDPGVDTLRSDQNRKNAINNLIVAGDLITQEISDQI